MRRFLLLTLCAACVLTMQAQVVINELMQSNVDCVMDDLNEFPDSWVELYNAGEESVDLGNYYIGISSEIDKAYHLPSHILAPKGYQLVYCDNSEAKNLAWHTAFRLESGKDGSVFLFEDSKVVDSVVGMKKQPAPNIAYGRKIDGSDSWGYQAVPTPNAANCGTVYQNKAILGDPIFSVHGQVFETAESVSLSLSCPEGSPEGTKILYTMDGSEPVFGSSSCLEYQGSPISIDKSVTVRALLYCPEYLIRRSVAQSYLFLDRKMTLPVVSLSTNQDYFYGDKLGIYTSKNNNSRNRNDWRRPVNIEYFVAPNEKSKINQLGETRVAGGASRDAQYKTLIIYANKRFGENKRFNYEFFPEDRPGQTEFKSLMLRNSGNDFDGIYMRDAIIQRSMAWHTDLDYQAYSPAIVFFNGEFWGLLNLRERSNDDNIYSNYNKLEDIDMVENWSELKAGTWDYKWAFDRFYVEKGHTLEEYEKWMDTSEYMNLMIMNLFYDNRDFPGTNIVMWRPAKEGGRWRWIAKDTDFGLGLFDHPYDYQTIRWIYDHDFDPSTNWANSPDQTRLFRHLMLVPEFHREFIDRCSVYMGDFLNYEAIWKFWEPMYDRIKAELPYHGVPDLWLQYGRRLAGAQKWLQNRPDFFYQHLADYFELGTPINLEINKELIISELAEIDSITVNGICLTNKVFDGKFFQNRELTLAGNHVTSWLIQQTDLNGKTTETTVNGSECKFLMPEASVVRISAIPEESQGIEQIDAGAGTSTMEYYDLNGFRRGGLHKGPNLVRMNDGSVKKYFVK